MKKDPGFYPDVSFDEYASWTAVNHSKLEGFENTAAHARYLFEHERPPTPATEFGWLAHLAILEPHRLWRESIVRPEVDGRTKEGRPILAEFKAKARGRKIITREEANRLKAMSERIYAQPTAREYLTGQGYNELSIVWIDKETRLPCKARLDRVGMVSKMPGLLEDRVPASARFMAVMDVKTIGKPSTLRNFEKQVWNYHYASQAAMYLEGLNTVSPAEVLRPFVWIVIETDPPHEPHLFTPTSELLEYGFKKWHGWLRRYADCAKSGDWPGWGDGIDEASLPPYAGNWEESL